MQTRHIAMEWTYESIARARDAVGAVLENLELDAYLFGVEPAGDHWRVHVEYATIDGWSEREIAVDEAALAASFDSAEERAGLATRWRRSLPDAKRRRRAPVSRGRPASDGRAP